MNSAQQTTANYTWVTKKEMLAAVDRLLANHPGSTVCHQAMYREIMFADKTRLIFAKVNAEKAKQHPERKGLWRVPAEAR